MVKISRCYIYDFLKIFVAVVMLLPFTQWAHSATQVDRVAAKVQNIKGDVFYIRKSQKQVLERESKIYEGDTVLTEATGRVKLLMSEGGNEVVLGASTQLIIERVGSVSSGETGTQLSLKEGKVRSTVHKKYSGEGSDVFQVTTPNAVAGVRGTVFVVSFDRNNLISRIATESGKVDWSSLGKKELVSAGMFSSASPTRVSPPEKIKNNPEMMQELQDFKEEVQEPKQVNSEYSSNQSQEIYIDSEGNEIRVEKAMPENNGEGRSIASVPESDALNMDNNTENFSKTSTVLSSQKVSVDVKLTDATLSPVVVSAPIINTQGRVVGNVPGLNVESVKDLNNLAQKNANNSLPATVGIGIK